MSDGLSPVVQFQRSGVQRVMKRAVLCCWFAIGLFLLALPLSAQQAPAAGSPASASAAAPQTSKEMSDKLAQLEQRVAAAQAAGDNAWMLTSAALVLMMTGPGLALFLGPFTRRNRTQTRFTRRLELLRILSMARALGIQ